MTQLMNSGLSDWLINSARRNPEGALLLAAGAVLLLRKSGALATVGQSEVGQKATEAVRETADAAKGYVSDLAAKASDSTKSFGADMKDYAASTKDGLAKHAKSVAATADTSVKSVVEKIVKEQPALIALAGVAAGVGLASVFPTSNVEKDAMRYASAEAKDALGRAGHKLKEAAQDITTDAVKRMAGEVISAAGGASKSNNTGGL